MNYKFKFIFLILALTVERIHADEIQMAIECAEKLNIRNMGEIFDSFVATGETKNENNRDEKADDAGNVDPSKMKEKLTKKYASKMKPDEIADLVDKCAARSESDPCDKVYQFHKCHMKVFVSKA